MDEKEYTISSDKSNKDNSIEESIMSDDQSIDLLRVSKAEVRQLCDRIEVLEYQHLVNLDRLEKYAKQEEYWQLKEKELNNKEKKLKRNQEAIEENMQKYKLENEKLGKEMKMNQKFVFFM